MSLEGSQLPAEHRISQIMSRLDGIGPPDMPIEGLNRNLDSRVINPFDRDKNFKAVASMMQSQMYGEAFVDPNNKDSSNPISSMMDGMGSNPEVMANLLQAGALQGNMGAMPMMGGNNLMMQAMMMNGMANPMAGFYNPTMQMQMMSSQQQAMVFPLKGQVSSEYGERMHPITGHKHFHNGVDIAAKQGTAIRMPWDGKVVYVGDMPGFGANTVVVAHERNIQADGKIIYSVFAHNEHVFVKEGERITQGDIFATVGSEGHSTGPHLHWETRIAEPNLAGSEIFNRDLSMAVDPMTLA